jgi:hypothetical protein
MTVLPQTTVSYRNNFGRASISERSERCSRMPDRTVVDYENVTVGDESVFQKSVVFFIEQRSPGFSAFQAVHCLQADLNLNIHLRPWYYRHHTVR